MRTLQARFAPDALSTLDTVLKHTKDVRVFRRAQAVREVVIGRRIKTVSQAFAFTYSALRNYRELGMAVAHHTGVTLHPDTIRVVLTRGAELLSSYWAARS